MTDLHQDKTVSGYLTQSHGQYMVDSKEKITIIILSSCCLTISILMQMHKSLPYIVLDYNFIPL